MPLDDRVIAISATFTAEAIQPGLAFWAGELGLDYEIRFAGYNQLFQELLDPAGLFGRNHGGFNVALVRLEDWADAGVEEPVRRLVDAVRAAAVAFSAPLILAICPSAPAYDAAAAAIGAGLADLPSVHVLPAAEILGLYPVADVYDPHANQLGHLPYTPLFFAALATAIARRIHAIASPPYKAIALDCDETLWAGICGEDGPQGVVLDSPRRALQEFMAERRREGMLLALCSKNNEEDVLEVFRVHPEMPLGIDDFAAWRINWESKGINLASLAAELGIGLDTFILVDDNPKECTEAQAGVPEVLALALPADPAEIPAFLRHVWAFDRARVTAEDTRRAAMYAQRAERARAERQAPSLQEFLESLRLEIAIAPMQPAQLPRVAQLTQRTNQMNVSGIRRTESGLRGLDCWIVSVQDRFGDYGLTGVMIVRGDRDALVADTFLLSCRALGRGVEHRMVAKLGEIARERGLAWVEIPFVEAQRNRPARLFLESIARQEGGAFRLTADQAAAVRYRVNGAGKSAAVAVSEMEDAPASRPQTSPRIDYVRIATGLRDPARVLEQIRAAARPAARVRPIASPPRTPLESELAELWAGLLNLPAVGIDENFFELGGHSLLAVQLLSRVRQIHGVELSLEVVYSGEFTVAELAKAVELKEIEQAGGDYQELLRELEGLSDEEVKSLLAEEQDADPSHL
jgi:FkbH-like protein